MSRHAGKLVVVLFAAVVAGCGGGGANTGAPDAAGTTRFASIVSAQTASPYNIDIWLPPGYTTGTATYPVVYATDCEYRFDSLQSVLATRARRGATATILVNICAGPTSQRFTDYTMPGAARYFAFLTQELIPYVETNYRTNPSKRVLSGHSLSGELVMYALYLEDPAHRFFTSIVSEEGSFWYDASFIYQGDQYPPAVAMETAMYNASRSLPIDLVMAGDSTGNDAHVTVLYNTIAGQQFQNLRIVHKTYTLGHVPMDSPAFDDAMSYIFGD
jgi:hypothetical protein